ncbi:MAG: serine/threonine protein kinase [Planctomycetes bacterium]|nr:serine/threonine protein kinase [Planctomycetota bacterium]
MAPDATAALYPGAYDVLSKITEDGVCTCYRGRDRSTGAHVFIKVLGRTGTENPTLLAWFERACRVRSLLDHPNVVKVIDFSAAPPYPFLITEYLDGVSIGRHIERNGAYPEREAVRLIEPVCRGLQHVHERGLVHRDVKPDNVFINRDGTVKLTGFDLARAADVDSTLTPAGRGLGTPHYMAPEQFRGASSVDARGDIYALGSTLYVMVTGVVPFANASPLDCWMRKIRNEFPSPKELNPALSDRVDRAIRRAMSAEPGQRPDSCREFLEDLTGQSRTADATGVAPSADVWYLVYRDESGRPRTVKGSTEGVRKALRDRLLGDPSAVVVSRARSGPFVPLHSAPEFRGPPGA